MTIYFKYSNIEEYEELHVCGFVSALLLLHPHVWCPANTPVAPLELPGPPVTQPKPQDPRGLLEVRKREEAKLIKNLITGTVAGWSHGQQSDTFNSIQFNII